MTLSTETRKHYRTIGHNLNPIVTVAGNGLSDGVLAELERALNDHELIKVKLAINDREERKELVAALIETTGALLVQEIGKVALIYRAAARPDPKKTNVR
jgi:RNA-binding protein